MNHSMLQVRDTFCSYGVMELCTKGLVGAWSPCIMAYHHPPGRVGAAAEEPWRGPGVRADPGGGGRGEAQDSPVQQVSLHSLVTVTAAPSFTTLFSPLGLSPRAVSTSFGCRQNIGLCLQGASSPDPTTVYVDLRALR